VPARRPAREPVRRPRTGRQHRLSGHFCSPHRNDGPSMLSGRGRQPQLWDIVVAATASMGHRCGCPARLNSIDVPSLRLRRPGTGGQVLGCARSLGPGRRAQGTGREENREPGAERTGNRERKEPATGSGTGNWVARNGAAAPDAVTFTKYAPEPHRWATVAPREGAGPGGHDPRRSRSVGPELSTGSGRRNRRPASQFCFGREEIHRLGTRYPQRRTSTPQASPSSSIHS
jgi:hypothetical protein